jgi:Rrf2 family protein
MTIFFIVLSMQLSMRTDYALRALFTLVENHGGPPIPIMELAKRNDIPKRFLEHIMLDLKERGWVDSVAGKRGGYRLAKNPGKITMGEVVRHFDGYLAPIACVSVSDYKRCSQEPVCRFRRVLLQARNMVAVLMDRSSLADVMRGNPVTDVEVAAIQGIHGEGI